MCWGSGNYGQLGTAETTDSTTPVEVDLGQGRTARAVDAGWHHTCAILEDGPLVCWGRNHAGQLGVGDRVDKLVPTVVSLGTGRSAQAISLALTHTCALLDDHSVKCWGGNAQGQVGMNERDQSPDSRFCQLWRWGDGQGNRCR